LDLARHRQRADDRLLRVYAKGDLQAMPALGNAVYLLHHLAWISDPGSEQCRMHHIVVEQCRTRGRRRIDQDVGRAAIFLLAGIPEAAVGEPSRCDGRIAHFAAQLLVQHAFGTLVLRKAGPHSLGRRACPGADPQPQNEQTTDHPRTCSSHAYRSLMSRSGGRIVIVARSLPAWSTEHAGAPARTQAALRQYVRRCWAA
jgi:hypothetical protein